MDNTLEELTTDSLKVILTKYKKDVVLNKFYNGHESIKYYKDILTIENIEEAYFCEKRVDLDHKKQVRRMLEERLERRRLEKELEDELDGDFNWDDMEP